MILMPYLKNVVRPSIPVGVILLVVVNILVYFGLQQRDESRYRIAFDYYRHSALAKLEPAAYEKFLEQGGQSKQQAKFKKLREKAGLPHAIRMMEGDAQFMRALRADQIIRPDNEDYGQWRQARRYYESVLASITVERYAFKTDKPSFVTALTHQFLHGDAGHLGGNMLILILIAPAVEALIGSGLFLLVYLVGGLGAVGMHWLLVGDSSGLVGASGAISAAMGAFAVLFRWRRIPFFYFVVVYFDIVRAPALLALPIWVAAEAAQLLWFGDGHVAYGAHLGGLLTGALLAWPLARRAASRFLPTTADEPSKEAEPDAEQLLQHHLAQGRQLMRNNAFDRARLVYAKAAVHAGNDFEAWRECVNITKLSPASREFHQVVRALLRKPNSDAAAQKLILETFREYLRVAQPRPHLDAETLVRLADRFQSHGCVTELERVACLLHATAPEHPRCREILLCAASGLHGAGRQARADELTAMAAA